MFVAPSTCIRRFGFRFLWLSCNKLMSFGIHVLHQVALWIKYIFLKEILLCFNFPFYNNFFTTLNSLSDLTFLKNDHCPWPLYILNMYLEDKIITKYVNMLSLLKASGSFCDSIPWFFSSGLNKNHCLLNSTHTAFRRTFFIVVTN